MSIEDEEIETKPVKFIGDFKKPHPILDAEFDGGYGGAMSPFMLAEDKDKIYFYVAYDGATWIGSVPKKLNL